ncbi:uncharacterized protein CDV56_101487 [Aspergillus thermomutatus]|uniref:Glutathione S-transferase 2 n=1 Tax=Aspergillus thermomutatus TaxID=41047 RepID=A0A397FXC2_ASPTH|nr:uncharacterized protein CDV56_101487 [Aspergillus thermomutatus]RHZ43422.1 hypothetical protein CDV56_101487 [Aspergillus thermomutatus]
MNPIILYGHRAGPNPRKVAMPAFERINPNGRVPAIEDSNTGITLWESGAIIEYLVERYDPSLTISFPPGSAESHHARQWLYFQSSGQGRYFGQAVWFRVHHPERIPSAVNRYVNEIRRVVGVLDRALEGRQYLVGGRLSYADISFVTWMEVVPWASDNGIELEREFPNVYAWLTRVKLRPGVRKILDLAIDLPKRK